MNFLIGLVIFFLALIFSGILYIVGLVQVTPVPYNFWLLGSMFLFYIAYKLQFKNKRVLKFYLLRKWIEFNSWFYKIDKKMTVGHHELNSMQSKAVKLWKICLKDSKCVLQCSIPNKQRQIESGKIFMVLSATNLDHAILSIFDSTSEDKCNFYEVIVPQPHLEEICQSFDSVVAKRMGLKEQRSRDTVEEIFDTLLSKQQKLISKV